MHRFQRTISHDSTLKPHALNYRPAVAPPCSSSSASVISSLHTLRSLRAKLKKNLSSRPTKRHDKYVFEFEEEDFSANDRDRVCSIMDEDEEESVESSMHASSYSTSSTSTISFKRSQSKEKRRKSPKSPFFAQEIVEKSPSDRVLDLDDEEFDENDKENIAKKISRLAMSIVAKDGRELFGPLPSRRIPIANIVRNQITQWR